MNHSLMIVLKRNKFLRWDFKVHIRSRSTIRPLSLRRPLRIRSHRPQRVDIDHFGYPCPRPTCTGIYMQATHPAVANSFVVQHIGLRGSSSIRYLDKEKYRVERTEVAA
ncbi:hypothetical protein T4D_10150 [Trichinella pseudospiralis]|uniref:Uncharacterized protein n=1 Tax=Trichinella pseudospiralis TaxID=6337 RepID=A0A0V1FPX3_TRIPS|nr:hypothetical protein T4D_10150 [Trichinella pseudospiralis]